MANATGFVIEYVVMVSLAQCNVLGKRQIRRSRSAIPLQGSNRGYKPIQLILGLFAGVWCGASCFGHLDKKLLIEKVENYLVNRA